MPTLDPLRSGESINTIKTQHTKANTAIPNNKISDSSARVTEAPKKDAFSISEQGKMMNEMSQKLANEPAFDRAKVEAIKTEIANNSYKIDANKLANNILNFEQGLKKNS